MSVLLNRLLCDSCSVHIACQRHDWHSVRYQLPQGFTTTVSVIRCCEYSFYQLILSLDRMFETVRKKIFIRHLLDCYFFSFGNLVRNCKVPKTYCKPKCKPKKVRVLNPSIMMTDTLSEPTSWLHIKTVLNWSHRTSVLWSIMRKFIEILKIFNC